MADSDWTPVSPSPAPGPAPTTSGGPAPNPLGLIAMPAAQGATKISDLLNRLDAANLARHARGGAAGMKVLQHGATKDYNSDLSITTHQAMGLPVGAPYPDWFKIPGVKPTGAPYDLPTFLNELGSGATRGFLNEQATAAYMDPLSIIQALGGSKVATELLEKFGLPAIVKSANAVHKVAEGGHLGSVTGLVGKAAGGLHNLFGVDSAAKRFLAGRPGSDGWNWLNDYAKLYASRGAARNLGGILRVSLQNKFDAALHDLSNSEQSQVFDAVAYGYSPTQLRSPSWVKVAKSAQQIRDLTDTQAWLLGTAKMRDALTKTGFTLPKEFQPFDRGPLSEQKFAQYQLNYLPSPKQILARGRQGPRTGIVSQLKYKNPRFNPQLVKPPTPIGTRGLQAQRQAFEDVFKKGSRSYTVGATKQAFGEHAARLTPVQIALKRAALKKGISASQVHRAFDIIPGSIPTQLRTMVDKALVDDPSMAGQFADAMKTFTDYAKGGLFFLQYPHQVNIGTLLALHSPESMPAAIKLYEQLKRMTPEQKLAAFGDEMNLGVVSAENYERQSPFVESMRGAASRGGVVGNVVGPIAKHYADVSKKLWSFDDAAKIAMYRTLLRSGMTPERAAYEVSSSLVDYSTISPAADAARFLGPFMTWGTKAPVATARGIMKNPGTAAAMNRATGGVAFGSPMNTPLGAVSFAGPTGEFGEATNVGTQDPARYARGRVADWTRTAGSVAGSAFLAPLLEHYHVPKKTAEYIGNYLTYGQRPLPGKGPTGKFDPGYGAESLPIVSVIQQLVGMSPIELEKIVSGKNHFDLKGLPMQIVQQILEASTRTYFQPKNKPNFPAPSPSATPSSSSDWTPVGP